MKIHEDLTELIGKTPLLLLRSVSRDARIVGKLEFLNPGGSSKDRVAKRILDEARRAGGLGPGGHLVEKSGGNTAIGLCWIAASRGYRVDVVVPEQVGEMPLALCRHLGAGIHPVPAHRIKARWEELVDASPGAFVPDQFANPVNIEAHRTSTAPEIWDDTEGRVDAIVAGIGTGGTLAGISRYIRPKKPHCQIIGVEPEEAPVASGGRHRPHGIHGIGLPTPPVLLKDSDLDATILVSSRDAKVMCRELARREGLMVGMTSGAVVHAAVEYAGRPGNAGKLIVVLLCDRLGNYHPDTWPADLP